MGKQWLTFWGSKIPADGDCSHEIKICLLLGRKVIIPISWRIFHIFCDPHSPKGFSVVNEAEVDVFLEFPCFFYDPMDVGNMVFGSSSLCKSSLYIWNFLVHILLKPSLKDFEHSFASVWNEFNCAVVWNIFRIAFLWNWNFSSPVATAEFSKVAGILSAAL